MKRLPWWMLLFYLVPYAFLCLWADALFGSMWGYAVSILAPCVLAGVLRHLKAPVLFWAGNLASYLSSLLFAQLVGLDEYGEAFKPFTPFSLLSLTALLLLFIPLFVLSLGKDSPRKRRARQLRQKLEASQQQEKEKEKEKAGEE